LSIKICPCLLAKYYKVYCSFYTIASLKEWHFANPSKDDIGSKKLSRRARGDLSKFTL